MEEDAEQKNAWTYEARWYSSAVDAWKTAGEEAERRRRAQEDEAKARAAAVAAKAEAGTIVVE